ncbi:MAG TPA: tandem-95 repeat protein, partial [Chromatiales bacterium]|nr:tandem-95 repeat protein [Chromatiales bacterium]
QGTRDYVRGVEFSEDPQLVAAADTGGDSVVPPTPNVPPQAKNDAAELNEHTSIDIDVLSNDIDPEGGPLTITDLSDPAHGSATLNPDDSIHYEPDAHYVGNDSFTYTVNDEDGASSTATVNILIVPTMPDAVADSAYSNGGPVTIDILANDTGLEDGPLIVVAGDGANGTVTIDPITHHAIYTPSPDFVGEDTFYYKVFDSHYDHSSTSVTVTVDEPLVANDDDPSDIAGFSGDSTVIFNVLDNDTGIDDQPLVLVAADGDNGVTSIDPNDLTIGYRPSADFSGDDSFLYKVFDADYDHDSAKVDVNGVLSGSETDDADLTGSAGNDILFGLGGNDTLDGGEGTDAVLGGAGDDVLIFDANDSFLDGGSGVDTLSLNWDDGSLDELLTKIDNIEQAELNTAGANGEQSYLLSDTGISSLSLSDGVISIDNSGNATNSDGITGLNFAQLSGGVSVFADVPIDAVFV